MRGSGDADDEPKPKQTRKETKMTQTLDDLFPSTWLKAAVDFAEGEEKTLTITGWEKGTFKRDGKDELSIDLTFAETAKHLGLNKGNREMVAKITGSRAPDDWKGKQITLFTIWTEARGETVRGIRVKPVNGHSAQPGLTTRDAKIEELKGIRAKIRELKSDALPAKPTVEELAGDGLDKVLSAHANLIESLKVELM